MSDATIVLPDIEVSTAAGLPDDPDVVSIRVKDKEFRGWQSVTITRSCESFPNHFTLTASSEFLQGDALAGTRPEQPCDIYIGSEKVITGWIDRRTINIDAHNDRLTISGRGITRNLVDCSADIWQDKDLQGAQMTAIDTLDAALQLTHSFKGLTARLADGLTDPGPPIPKFQISNGETPYQIIESVARYAGFMVYEDADGILVLDRVGSDYMGSGFEMPGNIETINAERSSDNRFSDYIIVWNPVSNYRQLDNKMNQRAHVQDQAILDVEYRPKVIVFASIVPDRQLGDLGLRMAIWERNRRYGRSSAVSLTCDKWRDRFGVLWQPNRIAPVNAPRADIVDADWVIGTVTFRKDMSGTHADLVLMPPEAFAVEPGPLNLFPQQLANPEDGSANPLTGKTPTPDPILGGAPT